MSKIFLGLIFIFFNFSIDFSFLITIKLNFLPDFIGYILIYFGLKEMTKYSKKFKDLMPISIAMMILATISDSLSFFMININLIINLVFNIALTSFLVYSLYKIIKEIKNIEKHEKNNYGSKLLSKTWWFFAISLYISYIIYFISLITNKNLITTEITIISILIQLIFIIIFYRSKHLFDSYH